MEQTFYPIRYIARITIETEGPLSIGSGEKSITTDAPILRDINGLPFIPGTSLAGVIRHTFNSELVNTLMGWQSQESGEGSRLTISDAKIIDSNGEVVDGLAPYTADVVLDAYRWLPIRQHVRIDHTGAAEDQGKFDEEVVYKGTRFCFDLELIAEEDRYEADFWRLIDVVDSSAFRLGGGSRNGNGKIKIIRAQYRKLDLRHQDDLSHYLSKSSDLSHDWKEFAEYTPKEAEDLLVDKYQITLYPTDFLLFGSELGDNDADSTYVTERQVEWEGKLGRIAEDREMLLIPGSSLKGAIAHRTSFYYNKQSEVFADSLGTGERIADYTGKNNAAVSLLFGTDGDKKGRGKRRGHVFFTDLFIIRHSPSKHDHIFNHVKIDRFTGGVIKGALFSERAAYLPDTEITFEIIVDRQSMKQSDASQIDRALFAFESALRDVCSGMLPLGGKVNKGNGRFYGSINKNGKVIYEYDRD